MSLHPSLAHPVVLGMLGAGLATFAAAADITVLPVVLKLPGTEAVRVRSIDYSTVEGRPLKLNAYRPPGAPPDQPLPAIVFVNGIGSVELPDWGQYTGWARLAAASGLAGVTYQTFAAPNTRFEDAVALSLAQAEEMFRTLRARAGELGIDRDRIAIWACSANVRVGFMLTMAGRVPGLRAVAFYYGEYEGSPRQDLPMLMVRAGLDVYGLNRTIERLVADALRLDVPLELINVLQGHHGFDIMDDTEDARAAMRRTLGFLAAHLAGPAVARPEAVLTSRSLYSRLAAGETGTAWTMFHERVARMRAGGTDNPLAFREISEVSLVGVGRDLLADGKIEQAVEAFKMAVEAYPDSPTAWDAVSEGLESAGRRDEALAAAERTLAVVAKAAALDGATKLRMLAAASGRIARLKR